MSLVHNMCILFEINSDLYDVNINLFENLMLPKSLKFYIKKSYVDDSLKKISIFIWTSIIKLFAYQTFILIKPDSFSDFLRI